MPDRPFFVRWSTATKRNVAASIRVEAQVGYSMGMFSEPRPSPPAEDLHILESISSSLPHRSSSFAEGLAVSLGPTRKLRDPVRYARSLQDPTRAEDCAGHIGYDSLIRLSSPLCLLTPSWLLFFCSFFEVGGRTHCDFC